MINIHVIEKLRDKFEGDIHFKELLKGSIIFFILRILGFLLTYTFMLLITRTMGTSTWGIFTLNLTILHIVSSFGRLGFDIALLKFISEYNTKNLGGTLKWLYLLTIKIVLFISILLFLVLYFLSSYLSENIFNKDYLQSYIRLVAFAIPILNLLYINTESIRAFKKIKEYIFLQNLFPNLTALVISGTAICLFSFYNTKYIVLAYILGLTFALFFSFIVLIRNFKCLNNDKEDISTKYVLSVAFPMFISNSFFIMLFWADTIMLGIWRTEEEVGVYNVAVRLSMLTSFTLASINSIAAPKFAELWARRDIEGLKRVAQQSTKLIFLSSTPILILYLLIPEWFMGLFGEEFKKGAPALVFLAIGQFVKAISGSVGYILQMTGKQKIVQNIILIATLINIVLNMMLIPRFGLVGASIASTFSICFISVTSFFLVKFYYNFYILPVKVK
ncbi:oligosaccharide flippase family protein [Aquifex pyrophilus]